MFQIALKTIQNAFFPASKSSPVPLVLPPSQMFTEKLKSLTINAIVGLLAGAEMETGQVNRHRSGRDSSTGRSSRLKYRSNSPFLQLKDIKIPTKIYLYILS